MNERHTLSPDPPPKSPGRTREIATPISDFADRLRKAARRGSGFRLEPQHVSLLMQDAIYSVIAKLEVTELNALCHQDNDPDLQPATPKSGSNAVTSGSGTAGTAMTGPSAGTPSTRMDADAASAASRLASAAVIQTIRRNRLKTH